MGYYRKQATSNARHISKAATISDNLDIVNPLELWPLARPIDLVKQIIAQLTYADDGVSQNKG